MLLLAHKLSSTVIVALLHNTLIIFLRLVGVFGTLFDKSNLKVNLKAYNSVLQETRHKTIAICHMVSHCHTVLPNTQPHPDII